MPVAFFLIQALAAASPATVATCPLQSARYQLADDAAITARFDVGKGPGDATVVTIADAHSGRSFRFTLLAESRQLGVELRFAGAVGRDGALLDYRPSYFRLTRGFFFTRSKKLVLGKPSAAPPYFFPSGLTDALYSAGAARPQEARTYLPAGMFVMSSCSKGL